MASKKSKILAMALCASVMTGIYASPVMAAGQISGITLADASTTLVANDQIFINGVELSGDAVNATGGNFTQLTVTNGMGITGGVLTVGGTSIDSTNGNTVVGGTLTATGLASLNGGLNVKGGLKVNEGTTVIDGGRLFANKGLTVSSDGILIEEGGSLSLADGNVDVGGNLTVNGETTLANTTVGGTLTAGATTVDSLGVTNNATVGGTLDVTGQTTLNGLTAGATTVDSLGVTKNATVGGTLGVTGKATFGSAENVTTIEGSTITTNTLNVETINLGNKILDKNGDAVYELSINANGSASFAKGDVTISEGGLTTFKDVDNTTTINGSKIVSDGGSLGKTTINGGQVVIDQSLKVGTGFEVVNGNVSANNANIGGNATIGGQLNVAGNVTATGDVKAADATFSGDVDVNGVLSAAKHKFEVNSDGDVKAVDATFSGTLSAAGDKFNVNGEGKATFKNSGTGYTTIDGETITSYIDSGNNGILKGNTLTLNGAGGAVTTANAGSATFTKNLGDTTTIDGGTITTGTLEVENIKLGNSMTDKDGNTITIGAAGVIDIEKDGNTVFYADTDNFEAHYDNYDLTLDGTNGFALSNETSSFTLNGNGFAFAGPVHLGNGTQVEFSHNGTDISLSSLVDRVEDLEQKTTGISFDENTGSTTIKDMNKVDGEWKEGDSSVTVGDNGTTFENGEDNGTTNINGSEIVSDATNVESGSGSGSGFGGGTSTTNGDNAVYVGEDGDYTHVSSDGVTIGDKTNTNTTNIDKDGMVVNGSNGTTHISDSGMTVTGENGTNNISDSGMTITGKDGNTTNNISDKGMTVTGSNGTTNISGGDISVDNSVTVAGGSENKTTINNEGITVGDKGTSIKHDEISVGDGGYIGGGDVVSGEGVSLNQTAERVGHLENRVGELEDRIDKVGAMAAAIANLRTMGYDPAAPTEVAVGIGQYRDETGAALGLFHYPNRDFMLSLSVSTSGDEVMGGIGATWKFGRKSPEKVAEIKKAQAEADARRAEEAKLAKAEEMKQAAKEAKIKAQQERHAKLAAERAAQAEAAK